MKGPCFGQISCHTGLSRDWCSWLGIIWRGSPRRAFCWGPRFTVTRTISRTFCYFAHFGTRGFSPRQHCGCQNRRTADWKNDPWICVIGPHCCYLVQKWNAMNVNQSSNSSKSVELRCLLFAYLCSVFQATFVSSCHFDAVAELA